MQKDFFPLTNEFYIHYPGSIRNFFKILGANAITSSEYGKHEGGGGCNGKHFISIAKKETEAYRMYSHPLAFILSSDICMFSNKSFSFLLKNQFVNSSYPFREPNLKGEYHVRDSISLDKAKAIFASKNSILQLVQIIYIQELLGNNLPLVEISDNSCIDKEIIKKYCKLKK